MSVQAISPVYPDDEVPAALAPSAAMGRAAPGSETTIGFGQLVVDGLQQVNQQLLTSQVDLQQLALGQTENLHEVLIRLEESRLSLQLLMQVRNRALEAYQDVMRMQI
jgi:flagellar hook-basal body complex protein FliE